MSAEYYKNLLKINQITPAVIEQKIRELEIALDDAKYFGKPQVEIDNSQVYIDSLKQVLAEDYAVAVARGLEYGPVLPPIEQEPLRLPVIESPSLLWPKVAFDGTVFTNEESREVAKLLQMVKDNRITKTTLLDFINSLNDQITGLKRNDPLLLELLMRRLILQHVVFTGTFKPKQKRKSRY